MYCAFLPIDGGPTTWQARLAGNVVAGAELARYTTYRVGGPARYLVIPANVEDVITVFRSGEDVFVMGAGSNILASDDGYNGVVLRVLNSLGHISIEGDGIVVGAGRTVASLARSCAEMGLSGLEWAVSIPGTVGGAACTNAGAFNAAFWDYVTYVDAVTPGGELSRFTPPEVAVSYRQALFPLPKPFAVAEVGLRLKRSDPETVASLMASYKLRREATQPVGMASAGCVFKNPPEGESAGALIEKAGLKGMRRGGAAVSEKHANFIVNEGGAAAADIYGLINCVRERVRELFGVELETEIEFLGEFK